MADDEKIYIKPEDLNRLPKGLRIYRGPRGGLYFYRSEYRAITSREPEGFGTAYGAKAERATEKQINYINALIQKLEEKLKKEYEWFSLKNWENSTNLANYIALRVFLNEAKNRINELDKRSASVLIEQINELLSQGVTGLSNAKKAEWVAELARRIRDEIWNTKDERFAGKAIKEVWKPLLDEYERRYGLKEEEK